YSQTTAATSPVNRKTLAGAAHRAHTSHVTRARVAGGRTANTRTAVVELVRNTAVICPKPASAAIARPAAARERGGAPSAATSPGRAGASRVTRPVAWGTAGPTTSPASASASAWPAKPPRAWATTQSASRYRTPDDAMAAPTVRMPTTRTQLGEA